MSNKDQHKPFKMQIINVIYKNSTFLILTFFLDSCSLNPIKVSNYAKLDENNRYVNNYTQQSESNTLDFFNFFWKTIFSPPEKKEFKFLKINKIIYENDFHLLTWNGHSTVLYQNRGLNILIDPIFSNRASPFTFLGPKRYVKSVLTIENIPKIDVVAITHNHYDHLDYKTVKSIKDKYPEVIFLVPLGMAEWFKKYGISKVKEFDWWENKKINDTNFIFLPTQHWSKRNFVDRNKSLWGAWWISKDDYSFLHLGDTGYSKDIENIKIKLGSPNLVAIPIGAYKPRNIMKNNHINPEEAVKIFIELEANHAIPIHWGTFILSLEEVDEPIKRLKENLRLNNINESEFRKEAISNINRSPNDTGFSRQLIAILADKDRYNEVKNINIPTCIF